jgi:hypothetical protein
MQTPCFYEIRVRGRLSPEWSAWFDGLVVTEQPDGQTLLVGPVADQAALHGILIRIRDLGLPLLSVNQAPAGSGRTGPATRSESAER